MGGKGGGGDLKEAVESPEEWEDIGTLVGSTSSMVSYREMHEEEVKSADGEEEDVLVRLMLPFVDCCR